MNLKFMERHCKSISLNFWDENDVNWTNERFPKKKKREKRKPLSMPDCRTESIEMPLIHIKI